MAPENATDPALVNLVQLGYTFSTGDGRSRSTQALFQLATLVVTVAMAIAGGVCVGFLVRLPFFQPLPDSSEVLFEDMLHWDVNPDEMELKPVPGPAENQPTGDDNDTVHGNGSAERAEDV